MSKNIMPIVIFIAVFILTACSSSIKGTTVTRAMTPENLNELILKVDEDANVRENGTEFKVAERDLLFVYDKDANRMRLMTPIAPAGIANDEVLIRMMQANYDAVLDVRYAQANNVIWAVFIHPLGSLTQDDFVSAVAQTVTAAETFGTSFTSGAVVFGGGDSNSIHQNLLKDLEKATDERQKI